MGFHVWLCYTYGMNVQITCIGAGNMGSALMKGAGSEYNIAFTDTDKAKAKISAKAIGARVLANNTEAVQTSDYVFLAVKPQVLQAVLGEIAPVVRERAVSEKPVILVSMAAGWSIAKIQSAIGNAGRDGPAFQPPLESVLTVRLMPNTPALVSQGLIAMAASAQVPQVKLDELEKMLGGAGIVDRIDEGLMDAVTGVSGSGPAFVCEFIEALADGGVLAGLPRDKALRYAAQTLLGTAAMILQTGKHPAELKDMVASPAGTTIAGIGALERGAFRGTVMSAVEAAWKRAQELGKP